MFIITVSNRTRSFFHDFLFPQTISKCKTSSLSTIHIQANSMETKESFLNIILVLRINNEDTKDYAENFLCDLVSSNNS